MKKNGSGEMRGTGWVFVGILVFCVFVLPRCGGAAEELVEKVELKFRFEEGKAYTLYSTIEQQIVMWMDEVEQETKQTIGIGQTWEVKEIADDGTATIVVTWGPVSMKVAGAMMQIEFDSEDPPEEVPMAARSLAALVDQFFTLKMTAAGRVMAIQGVDKMLEKVFESLELPDGEMKDAIVEGIKSEFGQDALQEMMQNMTGILPKKPVGVGDSWSQKVTLTATFPAIMENTYTLIERKDGVATIKLEGTIKPNKDAPPVRKGPMKMRYDLKGWHKGTIKLDEATGWFVAGEVAQEISGVVFMKGAPGDVEERSLPIVIEGVTKFESK